MRSFMNRAWSRALLRRLTLSGALALVSFVLLVPAAFAWHGHLQVRTVNIGGPAQDAFNFKIEKTPNLYEDIWSPGYKEFQLHGATSSAYTATIDCGTGVAATLDAQTGKWTLGGIQPGQDITCTIHTRVSRFRR